MSSRVITNQVLELCEQGVLSWESLAKECLCYMSEADVSDMNDTNEWIESEEDSEN